MKRKEFLKLGMVSGGVLASSPLYSIASFDKTVKSQNQRLLGEEVLTADMVIAGGGLGGCAAAMAALRGNLSAHSKIIELEDQAMEEFELDDLYPTYTIK